MPGPSRTATSRPARETSGREPSGVPGVTITAQTRAKSVPQLQEALHSAGLFAPQPSRSPNLDTAADVATVLAAVVGGYFLLRNRTSATTTSTSSTSGTTSSSGIPSTTGIQPPGSVVNPALGTPVDLRTLGSTAHSVVVACNRVQNAFWYKWYEYPNGVLLAQSPTNVTVIQGLQANTDYDVFCVVQNSIGQSSTPSQTLLIRTSQQGPTVTISTSGGQAGTSPPSIQTSVPSISGLTVSILATSKPTAANATITGYLWSWGDGTTTSTGPGTRSQASHTYNAPGYYTWSVTSTDSNGASASAGGTLSLAQPVSTGTGASSSSSSSSTSSSSSSSTVQPTLPGLPSSTSPSGVTVAPYAPVVQTQPSTAATSVFRIVSVAPVNSPVPAGQRALVDVTVRNIGDISAATTISGYMRLPTGSPTEGNFAPTSTGVVPLGQTVTVRMASAGRLSVNIAGLAAAGYQLRATFIAANGQSGQSASTIISVVPPATSTASAASTSARAATSTAASTSPSSAAQAQAQAAALLQASEQAAQARTAAARAAAAAQAQAQAQAIAQQSAARQQAVFKAQLQQLVQNPYVTQPLTSSYTQRAQASSTGQSLLSQYNNLGTQITQLRARIGLLLQSGQTMSSSQVQSLVSQWNSLAAQQSALRQRIAALPQPSTSTTSGQVSLQSGQKAAVSVLGGQRIAVVATGNTQTFSNGTQFTPATTASAPPGALITLPNGAKVFAPAGSTLYNQYAGMAG